MDDFLDTPFPAMRGQAPDLIPIVDIPEEEIVFPQDGHLMHRRGLGLPVERVFEPVLQNPDAYLMPRYAPFEALPADWEAFSGNNYLGVQQHLQEELEAPEQVEDMDNEEEDLDGHELTMDCTKTSSQDVDSMSSASQPVAKRADLTTNDLMLKDIGSSSSSVSSFGLQDSAMPDAAPAAFGPTLEPVTTSETLNI